MPTILMVLINLIASLHAGGCMAGAEAFTFACYFSGMFMPIVELYFLRSGAHILSSGVFRGWKASTKLSRVLLAHLLRAVNE